MKRRALGISTSWPGGAVLVSSCPYPPPRGRGRVAVALSQRWGEGRKR